MASLTLDIYRKGERNGQKAQFMQKKNNNQSLRLSIEKIDLSEKCSSTRVSGY